MSAPSYKLNPQSARETDNGFQRIEKSGAYEGEFIYARHITANSGAIGIEFHFKSTTGEEANYLTLYTRNANGETIFGEKQLSALMTCLKVREIAPANGDYEVYDLDAKANVKKQGVLYSALAHKPIGIVLQREEYYGQNGDIKSRMNISRFFEAGSRKMAVEILDNLPATRLDLFLPSLKDKTLSPKSSSRNQYPSGTNAVPAGYDDFADDDIPF